MRKLSGILLIAFVLSLSFSVLQAQEKGNDVYVSKSVDVNKTEASVLHNRVYTWLTTYYRTEGITITAREVDEVLTGLSVEVPLKSGATLGYSIRFDLKDDGYTYTISKLSMEENTEIKKYMDDLDTTIKGVMNPELKKSEKK